MSNIFEPNDGPEEERGYPDQPFPKPKQRKPRTWSQYQEMRRKNPKVYYQSRTQREAVEDRMALGKRGFYGEDG